MKCLIRNPFFIVSISVFLFSPFQFVWAQSEIDHMALASQAYQNADFYTAEKHYKIALRESPNNSTASIKLAEVLSIKGDYVDALTQLEQLPAQGNNNVEALRLKAHIQIQQGEMLAAEQTYLDLMGLAPENPIILKEAAAYYRLIGNSVIAEQISALGDCLTPEEAALNPDLVCD